MPPKRAKRADATADVKSRTFEQYYTDIFGDRWPALRRAMLTEPRKIALRNRFCQLPLDEVVAGLELVDPEGLTQAYQPKGREGMSGKEYSQLLIGKPIIDEFGIRGYYLMDYASALVVEQLKVGAFDRVLDVCAAPGGKSIAICQYLSPEGELTSNEARADRCARLKRNLIEHVPVNYVPWRTTQRKAETWYDPGRYSCVLVDAPCSSERHLLLQAGGSAVSAREWSSDTTVKLAALQRSILQRALETCAVGGRVVYSTCSISPLENDGVVADALRRTRCEIQVVTPEAVSIGEPTEKGWILLPDVAEGWGPMYFSVLHKVAERKAFSSSEEDESESVSDGDAQ